MTTSKNAWKIALVNVNLINYNILTYKANA